jgi:phospholipid/cholesterol/gamma-HCH transport system permease protein
MDFIVTLKSPVYALGRQAIGLIQDLGKIFLFFCEGFVLIFKLPLQYTKFKQQVYFIGMKSVFVICLTGAFTGMVLGLQGYYALLRVGSTGALGAAVALPLIREMGPVLTAVMIIARAGSAMAGESGIMRISEQIEGLENMDINPIRFWI